MKRRGKKRARPQAAKKKPQAAKKKPQAARKKPKAAAKRKAVTRKAAKQPRPAPKPVRPPKRRAQAPAKKPAVVAKPSAPPAVDFPRELKRERANRRKLEKRLTALVQELGQVRMYEVRCGMLEEELRKRDEELAALRRPDVEPDPQAELPLV